MVTASEKVKAEKLNSAINSMFLSRIFAVNIITVWYCVSENKSWIPCRNYSMLIPPTYMRVQTMAALSHIQSEQP